MGDTRYRLEPNVKEDMGGLRDLHSLYWIARYLYGVSDVRKLADKGIIDDEAAARFVKAHEFLSAVRCHIHYLTGRPENRLTFDLQREIAPRLGYHDRAGANAVERFMKHYFLVAREVGDLTRIFCTLLEESGRERPLFRLPAKLRRQVLDGFIVEGGRIGVKDEALFEKEPIKLLGIFHTALENGLDFQPAALRLITHNARRVSALRKDPEANRIFMAILTSPKGPEATLRLMSECGVFGRFIPDFARVVAQMQYDMYHQYTTDEHTIRAIGILHRIEARQAQGGAAGFVGRSSTPSPRGASSMWRYCSTTSPRGAAAITPTSALRSRSTFARALASRPRRPRPSAGL